MNIKTFFLSFVIVSLVPILVSMFFMTCRFDQLHEIKTIIINNNIIVMASYILVTIRADKDNFKPKHVWFDAIAALSSKLACLDLLQRCTGHAWLKSLDKDKTAAAVHLHQKDIVWVILRAAAYWPAYIFKALASPNWSASCPVL